MVMHARKVGSTASVAAILLVLAAVGIGPAFASQTAGDAPTSSGDTSQEQPVSRADAQGGGANGACSDETADRGQYCSTRDGSASGNGASDGDQSRKPCAGCVGRADNKNPPGQLSSASPSGESIPAEAGYECDANQGVGQGNPAHTACTDTAAPQQVGTSRDGATDAPPEVLGVQAETAASRDDGAEPAPSLGVNRATPDLAAQGLLPETGLAAGIELMLAIGVAMVLLGATGLAYNRRLRYR